MKFSETELQAFLWENREHFSTLLRRPPELAPIAFADDLADLTPTALLWNRMASKLESAFEDLFALELIGSEVPLEQAANSTIRADLLGAVPGDTGLAIIELKKSAQTERQALTELLAYSHHLAMVFPGTTRDDSFLILISPMATRICRDAFLHSLTFDNRRIVALVPHLSDPDDLSTLSLTLWLPRPSEVQQLTRTAFRDVHFSVCKVVWQYSLDVWDLSPRESPPPELVARLNFVSAMAAQAMEEQGVHGFTYSSQVWSELEPALPYTNALVLVGLNPYAVGGAQFLSTQEELPVDTLPPPQEYLPNISELIPGLRRSASALHEDTHYLATLYGRWDSQLLRIGREVVTAAVQTATGTSPDIDQGFMDWHTYQEQLLEDAFCYNLEVRPTGLLRHLYRDVTALDYALVNKHGIESHPVHGDLPHCAVTALSSQELFRSFIHRLLGDPDEEL